MTKLTTTSKTPNIINYTLIRTDTYIKHNITCTDLNIPTNINTHNAELQIGRIHTNKPKVSNLYILDAASPHYTTFDNRYNKLHATHHRHTIFHTHS